MKWNILNYLGFTSPYNTVISFGDSYSSICGIDGFKNPAYNYCAAWLGYPHASIDSLQIPATMPRKGENWLQLLTGCTRGSPFACKTRLFDFAHAGATTGYAMGQWKDSYVSPYTNEVTPYMSGQVQQFLNLLSSDSSIDPAKTLVTLWFGINDVFNRDYHAHGSQPYFKEEFTTIAQGIALEIGLLKAYGFHRIIVLNVPDISMGSVYSRFQNTTAFQSSDWFNDALREHVDTPTFDVASLFQDILKNHETYGISNVNENCVDAATDACMTSYFWLDGVHVTQRVHQIIAERVTTIIP